MSGAATVHEIYRLDRIDWPDINLTLCVGLVYAPLKVIEIGCGNPENWAFLWATSQVSCVSPIYCSSTGLISTFRSRAHDFSLA
jgi:hypothetical protein